jgi:hypothetical protein
VIPWFQICLFKCVNSYRYTSVLLQILPLFIGYISLTVPAGLTLYWLFNNVFTTATQVYLRQGGGAVAKIEKIEDVKLKVPLGCAVVDLETIEQQAREEPFEGPYVIWGDAEVDEGESVDAAAGWGCTSYKLNPVDPWLESAWFQPFCL